MLRKVGLNKSPFAMVVKGKLRPFYDNSTVDDATSLAPIVKNRRKKGF